MSNYVRDEDGKFIPASQRPDGTWRKARRVKDGYVPQEEVPLYESKGKQFTRKPDLPVGMSPQMAKEAQERRAKLLQKQNAAAAAAASAAAASSSSSASASASSSSTANHSQHNQHQHHSTNATAAVRKPANAKSKSAASASVPATASASSSLLASATQSMASISLKSEEEVQKQLKKLRKKIREIEAIEERLSAGELKQPEQDQLDKVARKAEHLRQIAKLEKL